MRNYKEIVRKISGFGRLMTQHNKLNINHVTRAFQQTNCEMSFQGQKIGLRIHFFRLLDEPGGFVTFYEHFKWKICVFVFGK